MKPLPGPSQYTGCYCPNTGCPYTECLEEGEACPVCATKAKSFEMREILRLSSTKKKASLSMNPKINNV